MHQPRFSARMLLFNTSCVHVSILTPLCEVESKRVLAFANFVMQHCTGQFDMLIQAYVPLTCLLAVFWRQHPWHDPQISLSPCPSLPPYLHPWHDYPFLCLHNLRLQL